MLLRRKTRPSVESCQGSEERGWKRPSLRRHDPDQVQRVAGFAGLSAPRGAPLGTTL